MNCPACKEPMIILEYQAVEVDYCVACHGLWLDAGELELLLGDSAAAAAFLTAGNSLAVKEKQRPCPICDRKMNKAATGGEQPVTYDACPRNHGQWFDQGELAAILTHGSPAAGAAAVLAWLREIFPGGDAPSPGRYK